jgi:heterodisulfide reductase subunit A-like polyferredoxin
MNNNGPKTIGAVMVIGGGIAGMQSALDLANSGFKVYMVEKTTSIGGRMAQLDKTFPTNDCSMCMISPKLIEVSKHRNIELITNAEVQSVEGSAGNFNVKVLKKPRYVDLVKCSSCGDCISACPTELKNEFECDLNRRKAIYKRYPQAIPGTMAISKANRPPCKSTCPAGCNGQGYVTLASRGKFKEAYEHIMQWIPLPSSVGRICHHPCEEQCNRAKLDAPLAIAPVKSFIGDWVKQKRRAGEIPPIEKVKSDSNKGRVAIIGAGPSGLTAAYDLVKKGYPVTIFEATSQPGGQLQWAIPQYRLPKDILAADIKDIIDLGIDLQLNTLIGKDFSLNDIKARGYQAIYIAIGTQKSSELDVPGSDLPGVIKALEFLKDTIEGKPVDIGKRVIVVGGGNVAMDAARTCIRLGCEVKVVYRRSRDEMPALPWEISEAEEEGVEIINGWGPKEIVSKNAQAVGMVFQKYIQAKTGDRSSKPSFDPDTTRQFDCDSIILTIGQATDLSFLPEDTRIETTANGLLVVDPVTLQTAEPGVFAGGDGVSGPKSAVEAIHHGHEAAISIDRFLSGQNIQADRIQPSEEPAGIPEEKFPVMGRVPLRTIGMEKRRTTFEEVTIQYTEDEVKQEAERCLNCGLCCECLQCVAVCQAQAIDHFQKKELVDIAVGSIIMAPGFDPFDAHLKGEYGYGRLPNVVTSLEFERILSSSGPYYGKILRPSDKKTPLKIAWIQCVGSRDKGCGNDYCSSVCCMYATKEAIIAREHDNSIQPTVFYNDIRAFGKGFERYFESAREKFGVRYIKSIPSTVKEDVHTHNLSLEYSDSRGDKVREEFDMVVLSVALVPSKNVRQLAERVGIQTDEFGFCRTAELNSNNTSREGIYVAGSFAAPIDIPESVMSASAAACLAGQVVSPARGTLVTDKVYPQEIDVHGQAPRIGVFVCRCGSNISRVVDVPAVAEYARTLPGVVFAEENMYTCSTDTQEKIIKTIQEQKLNRVVVASCSPRTHEPLFQDTIREGGLNPYLFEMANIRDQCSWVHASQMAQSTAKAKDLVRMAVARAAQLTPLHQQLAEVNRKALIIGGGLAGMTAAKNLSRQGYESVIVERQSDLGGNLKRLFYTENGTDPQDFLKQLVQDVESDPHIQVYKKAAIKNLSGFMGNFQTDIGLAGGRAVRISHGVVLVATGGTEYRPSEYLYGNSTSILTQLELEQKFKQDDSLIDNARSIVMIQCVGSREESNQYCSRVCCSQAISNAILLKKARPEREIYILYRDIRSYGLHELHYRQAREMGINFIHFDVNQKPEVELADNRLSVTVFDIALKRDLKLTPDLLVLSAAIRPQSDAAEFASQLKLSLTQENFIMEAHMKLRPLDMVNEGMYLCGLAHSPKNMAETIIQATGAVSRALTVLSQPYLMVGGVVSVVDKDRCCACLTCVRSCPYDVPRINADGVAEIEPAGCQGCGICASVCPRKAITLQNYSDNQIMAKLDGLFETAVLSR